MMVVRGATRNEPVDAAQLASVASLADYLRVLGNERRLQILRFLVEPHYVEEIASRFKIARQSAQAHVQQLAELGVVSARRGKRETGAVTDYVVVPHRLFAILESLRELGQLEPQADEASDVRALTQALATDEVAPQDQLVPRFTVVHGLRIGHTSPLTGGGPWLIGRDATAQVSLDSDPFVSTRHAEVRRTAAGGLELADLYSRNGTFADWRKVARGGTVALTHGTVVKVGRTLLVFRAPS